MIAQFFFLLQIVAPVFIVMAAGYGTRKIGILTAEADRSLTRLVVLVLAPCLAFDIIIGNEALAAPKNWILPPVLGFGTVVLGIGVARAAAAAFGIPVGRTRRTFVFTTAMQNYGYIPIPLCAKLFDRETSGVLFALFLGIDFAFWSIALWQLTGHSQSGGWRQFVNPRMIAIPAALVLNGLGAARWIPESIATTYHLLGQCAVPLALVLSGALIADFLNRGAFREGTRTILLSTAVRIGIVPFLILVVTKLLPIGQPLQAVLILQAAMPAAIFPIVVTKAHDGDVATALQVVMGTSLVGLLSIPLWIGFGMWWIL